jgi:hypothetical protein
MIVFLWFIHLNPRILFCFMKIIIIIAIIEVLVMLSFRTYLLNGPRDEEDGATNAVDYLPLFMVGGAIVALDLIAGIIYGLWWFYTK